MAMLKDGNNAPIPVLSIKSVQAVAYTTSTQSSAMSADSVCRIVATTDCHIDVGTNPTATTSETFLPASVVDYIFVRSGEKIAAVQNAAGGTLFITVME